MVCMDPTRLSRYDLGSYTRPITTSSPEAHSWFSRGLLWTYAFNHQAAADCFAHAAVADPSCAMAHWGVAFSLGPNYNKPWAAFESDERADAVARTHAAAKAALAAATDATPVEQALIQALQNRCPPTLPDDEGAAANAAYATAMQSVYAAHSTDLDIAALYADALMNLTPWALWDISTGLPAPGSHIQEILSILSAALATPTGHSHPGLLHLDIHAREMSPTPETAVPLAKLLGALVPDAGHLHHMPSHLYMLCGDYKAAMEANAAAVLADEKFFADCGGSEHGGFYTLYRCHDLHFLLYAGLFAGNEKVASGAAEKLAAAVPETLLRVRSPPMADWLEGFVAMRVHVLVRFGRWEEILALSPPDDGELYCTTLAMQHYAKGVASAALGDGAAAKRYQMQFEESRGRVPASRTVFNNACKDILGVAARLLDGEVKYRTGDVEGGLAALRAAVAADDALPYDEPWGWMQPTRHALGALLLEAGKVEEAKAVYAADLGLDDTLPRALRHPRNIWSLHGYHECLMRLGEADGEHAEVISEQLRQARAASDVNIVSSCFCRRNT